MRGILRLVIILVFGLCIRTTTIMAAPPPTEVEEKKNEAPLHLIGKVTSDKFFKDLSKSEQYPQQLRRMNLKIIQFIKGPDTEKENTSIEVFYGYIPSWQAKEYNGGERMDISVGDVIEVWLTDGEYGWEPALGGNTVDHIKYAENRTEPIPEPFFHSIERKSSSLLKENTEAIVLVVVTLILLLIIVKAMKSEK